jgi:hypothetical protein
MTGRRALTPPILIGIILLVVGLIAVCVIIAVFLYGLISQQPQAQGPVASPPDLAVPTAREAYPPAVELIRQEDAGAQLASAAGAWTPIIALGNLDNGRTGWTFHFYLPATERMAWVSVGRDLSTRVVKIEDWETPPGLLDDQSWQVDSPQAIAEALETCRPALDANDDAEVEARLSLSGANRALVWDIRVSAPGDDECGVRVDATTGRVR